MLFRRDDSGRWVVYDWRRVYGRYRSQAMAHYRAGQVMRSRRPGRRKP